MSDKPIVYVVQHNHFDPIWRRCWDRTFDYRGKRYRSYADLEEHFFNIWLDNAKEGAVFSEGQAAIFRKYLERNPHRLSEVQELVKSGLIELTAGGETVPDTNMPSGETLLRNLVMGQLWFEENFGMTPTGGWLEDAFGQSAQVPQIYRGCGCKMLHRLSYKRVPGMYWKGLDGTVIFTGTEPYGRGAGHCIKIAPCSHCSGVGCDRCEGRGLSEMGQIPDDDIRWALEGEFDGKPFSLVGIGGEEAVPNRNTPSIVKEMSKKLNIDFQWGGYNKIEEFYQADIAKCDETGLDVSDQVEANPVSTGCYVTRIKIKQDFRRIENLLNTAERWATIAWMIGSDYPDDCLLDGWRDLVFAAFHDAITSTHVDQAYYEILDMLGSAEHEAEHVLADALETLCDGIETDSPDQTLAIFNADSWDRSDPATVTLSGTKGTPKLLGPDGEKLEILDIGAEGENVTVAFKPPVVPALGFTTVHVETDDSPIDCGETRIRADYIANDFYHICCGEHGITAIIDRRTGRNIVEASNYLANELILEEDIGHPWGTMNPPSFEERLGKFTTKVTIRQRRGCQQLILTGQYHGNDSGVKTLSWKQTVTLYQSVDRINFKTEINWDTAQRRIRIAFPTVFKTSEARYAIPYGSLVRGPYQPELAQMHATNGDWGAVNWIDVTDGENGVALINNGTPSHKVIDGTIFVSVLRSPTDSWCINEPEHYDCPDYDGARDAGNHVFEYALIPHQGDFKAANIEKRAVEFNNPLQIAMPTESCDGRFGKKHGFIDWKSSNSVILSALKKAYKSDSVVARVFESSGEKGVVDFRLDGTADRASHCDYLERSIEPVKWPYAIGKWKIESFQMDID